MMTAKDALRVIYSFIKDEPVVLATGFICRTAQEVQDRPQNFYMIGSMGMASSIALGIALAQPSKRVIALDGDGAVLMNLGMLATVGAVRPSNFIHIVIDNAGYESTGGQPSFSAKVALEKVAAAGGYRHVERVTSAPGLKKAMTRIFSSKIMRGPEFLLARVSFDSGAASPRVKAEPEEITAAFSRSLK